MAANELRSDLLRLINGYQASQALHVAATLGLADLVGAHPRSAAELAAAIAAHPDALYRLMRALASIGVFREDECSRFVLAPMGEFLRRDAAGTHAPMAELVGQAHFWHAWGDLLTSVRKGVTAFDHVHGTGVWAYRAGHPEESAVFDRAMASGTQWCARAVMDVCDFHCFREVVDVGGGDGAFIAEILEACPGVRGTVFDQPHVATRAAAELEARGLSARCRSLGGDFFAGVPEGGNAYLLKWILHDWDDTAAIDILRSCRRAMTPAAKLLVVEHVIGPPNSGPDGKFMDLTMMVMAGGRERTQREFAGLFAEAGFRLESITPTATPLSLIEGAAE